MIIAFNSCIMINASDHNLSNSLQLQTVKIEFYNGITAQYRQLQCYYFAAIFIVCCDRLEPSVLMHIIIDGGI